MSVPSPKGKVASSGTMLLRTESSTTGKNSLEWFLSAVCCYWLHLPASFNHANKFLNKQCNRAQKNVMTYD